jgi:hypothetical protein
MVGPPSEQYRASSNQYRWPQKRRVTISMFFGVSAASAARPSRDDLMAARNPENGNAPDSIGKDAATRPDRQGNLLT